MTAASAWKLSSIRCGWWLDRRPRQLEIRLENQNTLWKNIIAKKTAQLSSDAQQE